MALLILGVFCADESRLGRLDYASMSQQTLMELVIDGIFNKEVVCGSSDSPSDIEDWKWLRLNDGKVTEIRWDHMKTSGSINFEWLPSTITEFSAQSSNFHGTIAWHLLPELLVLFNVYENSFSGDIDLEHLPQMMKYLRADSC